MRAAIAGAIITDVLECIISGLKRSISLHILEIANGKSNIVVKIVKKFLQMRLSIMGKGSNISTSILCLFNSEKRGPEEGIMVLIL